VFFNLLAAAEPSANVCIVHGTLCNDTSVYGTLPQPHETVVANFVSSKFGLFRRNSGWKTLY